MPHDCKKRPFGWRTWLMPRHPYHFSHLTTIIQPRRRTFTSQIG